MILQSSTTCFGFKLIYIIGLSTHFDTALSCFSCMVLRGSLKHIPGFLKYSRIRISRTSKGNENWFQKSGVREIDGGIDCNQI